MWTWKVCLQDARTVAIGATREGGQWFSNLFVLPEAGLLGGPALDLFCSKQETERPV